MNVSLLLCFLYVFFSSFACSRSCCRCTFCFILVFCWPLCLWHHYIYNFFVVLNGHRQRFFFFVFVFFLRVLLAFLILLYICVSAKSSVVCDCNWIARNASTQCVAFCILHIGVNCLWRCSPMPPQSRKICIKMHFRIFVRCSSKTQTANNKAKKKKTPTITTTIDKDDK